MPGPTQAQPTLHYLAPGTVIGGYEVVDLLGEGGFAEVYSAVAQGAHENGNRPKRVALKVVKRGMDSREIVARFRGEHRTLQSLSHPSIVQVFEAGVTESGLPYFVMDQVDGIPVTDYCETARLSLESRLRIFVLFCGAVLHAHQKGVLHRDLKPSNILVEESAEGPIPKVIDFGVARALEPVGSGETLVTQLGQVLGTPTYMSPEQAAGSDEADTRSDIYSLGAVLYEMLTGCPPCDVAVLSRLPATQWARHLHESIPLLPSARLKQQGGSAERIGKLRGGLDQIVRKAIARDPEQRYASAAGLARDVQAWLDGRPVAAHPPSLRYLAKQFVAQHRWPVAVGISILAGIIATAGIGTVLAIRARASEAQALREKDRAVAAEARASEARERSEHHDYQTAVQLAKLHLEQGEPYLAAEKLWQTAARLRGWEWGFLMASIAPPEVSAKCGLSHPALLRATPGGEVAVLAERNQFEVVDLRRNRVIASRTFGGRISRLTLSDDGTRVAAIEITQGGEMLHVAWLDASREWSAELCQSGDIAWEPTANGGALLAVCGNGSVPSPGRLTRFDALDGRVLNERVIERFKVVPDSLAIGRAGRMAVVATSYKDLEIVALPTLETLAVDQQSSGEAARAFLLDDARDLLVVARGARVYTGRASQSGSSVAGELMKTKSASSVQMDHLNWLPDGRWLAAGEGSLLVEGEPAGTSPASGAVALAPLSGGRVLALLDGGRLEIRPEQPALSPAPPNTFFAGDDAEGRGTAFTPDSRYALFEPWRRDGIQFVSLEEIGSTGETSTWARFAKQPAAEWSALPLVCPDGAVLTNIDGQFAEITGTGDTPQRRVILETAAWSASISRDGSRLAVAVPHGVRILDWPSGTLLREWTMPEGPFRIALLERGSPRGIAVLALSRDATLHYLPMDGEPVAHPMPFRVNGYYPAPVAFHSGESLVAGALTEGGFAVYELSSLPAPPRVIRKTAFVPIVTALAFSPKTDRLAVATEDHRLALWDWPHELSLLTFPLNSTCASIAFSPDSRWLANTDYAPSFVLRRAVLSPTQD